MVVIGHKKRPIEWSNEFWKCRAYFHTNLSNNVWAMLAVMKHLDENNFVSIARRVQAATKPGNRIVASSLLSCTSISLSLAEAIGTPFAHKAMCWNQKHWLLNKEFLFLPFVVTLTLLVGHFDASETEIEHHRTEVYIEAQCVCCGHLQLHWSSEKNKKCGTKTTEAFFQINLVVFCGRIVSSRFKSAYLVSLPLLIRKSMDTHSGYDPQFLKVLKFFIHLQWRSCNNKLCFITLMLWKTGHLSLTVGIF